MNDSTDQGRAAAALEIRKAIRRGPTGSVLGKSASGDPLWDVVPPHEKEERMQKSTQLRKRERRLSKARFIADAVRTALEKVGVMPPRAVPTGGDCSTIRKIHAAGPRLMTPDGEWLRKVSAPPQSSNGRWDNTTADAGGSIGTQRQSIPDQKTTRLGPTHAASMSDGKPPPEDSDNEDPSIKAMKAIHAAGPKRGL